MISTARLQPAGKQKSLRSEMSENHQISFYTITIHKDVSIPADLRILSPGCKVWFSQGVENVRRYSEGF
ncbi:hypothetical protein AC068_10220 [Morganella morganii]|nr:hypothetical protein AKG16_09725 [Morganella morganii]KOO18873.1 hypothetical protein AC068_10220 [Morganella morganii]